MKTQLQILPLIAILALFLIGPILIIFVVSFWDYTEFSLVPDFVLTNYVELFESSVTYSIYLNTLKFAALSWILTLVIGFGVAYFLAFHVRQLRWQVILFLVCTIPFWTSNIIRMIAWIPVLGRHGLINKGLVNMGIVDQPVEWLLYSDFAYLQFHDADRQVSVGGRARRRCKRDAGPDPRHYSPLPPRHCHWHDLCCQFSNG